jgi:hypothetical protein
MIPKETNWTSCFLYQKDFEEELKKIRNLE